MLVRYLPLIFILTALALALAPLEAAGQTAPSPSGAASKAEKPRPKTAGAPVNANAGRTPIPPGADVRAVRPAQAFPPERIAPSRTPQAPTSRRGPKAGPGDRVAGAEGRSPERGGAGGPWRLVILPGAIALGATRALSRRWAPSRCAVWARARCLTVGAAQRSPGG